MFKSTKLLSKFRQVSFDEEKIFPGFFLSLSEVNSQEIQILLLLLEGKEQVIAYRNFPLSEIRLNKYS